MPIRPMTGGEALARGALAAGIRLATGYPGSPSSEVIEHLLGLADATELHVEWASNERVSLEAAIGLSIAGHRALVCTKSVGMNVMLDPLMVLNLTPVHGGLVILLGDDPGGYGSQNDQDTRALAPMLEIPMLEPASPMEAYAMMSTAFDLSERFRTPIIIRETRSFAQSSGQVELPQAPAISPARGLGLACEPWRFVPIPSNVVAKHRSLHDRLRDWAGWAETAPFLEVSGGGERGILAVGFAASKLADVLAGAAPDRFRVFRLGMLHPLPEKALGLFLAACRDVLVVEETEPFVERAVHAIAHAKAPRTHILGKLTGHMRPEGELFRWQIRRAILDWQPDLELPATYSPEAEPSERPRRESYCAGCRYDEVLDAIDEVARDRGVGRPLLVGDPGCLATIAERLDAKYAIGSAIGVAHGLALGGTGEKVIALFGDSAFFHSAIPALCHAVACRSPILMIVLDNRSTLTSGDQPHPGVGRDARGRPAPRLEIARIARSCGVDHVHTVPLTRPPDPLRRALADSWAAPEPALIVVEFPQR